MELLSLCPEKLHCPVPLETLVITWKNSSNLGFEGEDNVEETKLSIKGWRLCPRSFVVNFMGLTLLIILPTPNVELAMVNSSFDVKNVNKMSDSLRNGFFSNPARYSSNGLIFDCKTSRPLPMNICKIFEKLSKALNYHWELAPKLQAILQWIKYPKIKNVLTLHQSKVPRRVLG